MLSPVDSSLRFLSLRPLRLLALVALVLSGTTAVVGQQKVAVTGAVSDSVNGTHILPSIPLTFEENDGQFGRGVSFLGRAQQYSVGVETNGLLFLPAGKGASPVDVRFEASKGGSPVALSSVVYRSNYYIGGDASQWHEAVPNFSRVGIRGMYPGIDAEFYEKNGEFEHDYVVSPGSDAAQIVLSVTSGQKAGLAENGDVVIPAGSGELHLRKPQAFQFDGNGKRVEVAAGYVLDGSSLRFKLGTYDRSRTLVIDPVIVFATYVTGKAGSTAVQLATATDSTAPGDTHLYVTGSVTDVTGFPPPGSSTAPTSLDNTKTNVFIASLSASNLGSKIDWISYLGGDQGNSNPAAIAVSANGNDVYVGGSTSAKHFPTKTGAANPAAGGSTTGFVSHLSAANGTAPNSVYISTVAAAAADATFVTGLDVDASGNVYLSGYGPGNKLADSKGLGITPNASSTNNAFVISLSANLGTTNLATYVESTTGGDYQATSVKVGGDGSIYVAGQTASSFPLADLSADFGAPCAAKTLPATSVFLAQILPHGVGINISTPAKSIFSFTETACGVGTDTAKGLVFSSGSVLPLVPASAYVAGDTTSKDFGTSIQYSTLLHPAALTLTPSGTLTTRSNDASKFGYVLQTPIATPGLGALAYIGDTSADTAFQTIALDSTDNLIHVGGTTKVAPAHLPGSATAGTLPLQQTTSATDSTITGVNAPFPGLLYSLTTSLDTVQAITYFGATSTQSTVESVQSDANGNAYVLVDDLTPAAITAANPASYTSAASIEPLITSAIGQHNAYVAEVQGLLVAASPAPDLQFAVTGSPEVSDKSGDPYAACTPATCEIGYDDEGNGTLLQYTWTLSTGSEASDVVLNFQQPVSADPANPILTPFTISDTSNLLKNQNGQLPVCVSAANGMTCTLNLPAGTTDTITLNTVASTGAASAANIGQSFALKASAADAAAEFKEADQSAVKIAGSPNLSVDLSSSFPSVDAASTTADTAVAGHPTLITYTVKLSNASTSADATNASFSVVLPAEFAVTGTSTVTGATCTTQTPPVAPPAGQTYTSGCTGVTVPKQTGSTPGTVTYTITGVYLAGRFVGTTAGPFTEKVNASASTGGPQTSTSSPTATPVSTSVNGYAILTASVTAPTPSSGTAFNLNSDTTAGAVIYTATVKNTGLNAAGQTIVTNTLPNGQSTNGFHVISSTCSVSGGGSTSACNGDGTGFTLSSLAAGATVTYTIKGTFSDNGASSVVDGTHASTTVTDTASFGASANTYDPHATAPGNSASSTAVTVQRLLHLKFTGITTSGTPAAGVTGTPNAYNLGTSITYSVAIQNAGPDTAVNVPLTTVFAPPSGYTPPNGFITLKTPLPSGVTCTVPPGATAATPNCSIGSLPPNATTTLAFIYTYPDIAPPSTTASAVPTTTSSAAYTHTASTTVPYSNAVDATPTPGDNTASQVSTIYRSYHLVLKLTNSGTLGETGAGYTQPAYDLGSKVSYAYNIVNQGPNYAINIPLTNSLQPPSGYAVPVNAFSISAPTSGNAVCTPAPNFTGCTLAYVAPNNTGQQPQFNVDVTYPDNPVTSTSFTAQDVSAVPGASTTAAYTYNANLGAAYIIGVDSNAAATATDGQSKSPINLYRTSHITFDTTSTPVGGSTTSCATSSPTPCFYMVNTGHVNDTAAYTVHVTNAGPDIATNATFTFTPPTNFLGAPNFVFNGPAQLSCTAPATTGAPEICKGYVPVSAGGAPSATVTFGSQFDSSAVPANTPFTSTNTPPSTPGSTGSTAAAIGSAATGTLPAVNIDRAVHLVTVKKAAPAASDVSPNGFTVSGSSVPAVNLDEKVAGNAPGANDLVDITVQVGNSGLNDATNVTVADSLPPYFIVTRVPDPSVATCSISAGTTTQGTPLPFTCKIAIVSLGSYVTGSSSPFTTGSASLLVEGKFQDNGLQADIVPANQTALLATLSAATSSSTDAVNLGSASDATSAQPQLPVMRAAHLRFTMLPRYVQPTAGDPPLAAIGASYPAIAEAQCFAPLSAVTTQCSTNQQVINYVRYQVEVTNDGPNIATDPIVSTALPGTFISSAQSIESSTSTTAKSVANCDAGSVCLDGGVIASHQAIRFNFDGNFGINTLTPADGNSGTRNLSSIASGAGFVDSKPSAAAADEHTGAVPITVVNTPSNAANGQPFTVDPFVSGGAAQPITITLNNVFTAGVINLGAAASTDLTLLPSAPSPNPPDNNAVKPLYRYGQNSVSYSIATTAGVAAFPANGNANGNPNPTRLCLNVIPDTFQKPERVLLWALANVPPGTVFNPILQSDQKTPVFSGAIPGDITLSVIAQGGSGYAPQQGIVRDANGNIVYPLPPAQAQPAQVCGSVNGLPTPGTVMTVAVLEPVNFAPYVGATLLPVNGQSQPGKGVTAAAQQLDLTIEKGDTNSPSGTAIHHDYDYNDADPCYTGGTTRGVCDDNKQLVTFLFTGGNIAGAPNKAQIYGSDQLAGPNVDPTVAIPQFDLPTSQAQLFLVMADQLGTQGYVQITYQGVTQVCDPGSPAASYTPSIPYYIPSGSGSATGCPVPPPLSSFVAPQPAGSPAQTVWPGLTDANTHAPDISVSVASLTTNSANGGTVGLVALPQPYTQPPPSDPNAVPKAGQLSVNVTAGQTVGFAWNWLPEQTEVQPTSQDPYGPVFNLSCQGVNGTDLAAAHITCTLPPSFQYYTQATAQGAQPLVPCNKSGSTQIYCILTAPPAIYVATTGRTAVGALRDLPGSKTSQILAAVVFPLGAIPLVLVLRRRKALKGYGWIAVMILAIVAATGIGCGGGTSFQGAGGTTSNATPSGTYYLQVTASRTDSSGNTVSIQSYPFAVVVSQVN